MRSRTAMIIKALTAAAATVLAITLVSNGGSGHRVAAGSIGAGSRTGSQSENHREIASVMAAGASKTCVYTATGTTPRKVSLPPARVNADVRYTAVLRTNLGN